MLIVDEVHSAAPSGRGKYAVDSLRTRAIQRLAPHCEHRLFLSATPHNGYKESFSALLELLDPLTGEQGLDRGARPLLEDADVLGVAQREVEGSELLGQHEDLGLLRQHEQRQHSRQASCQYYEKA